MEIENLILTLTNNFVNIIHIGDIKKHPILYWGGNGVGDRWANKKFNYSIVYSNKNPKTYSENETDHIPELILSEFLYNNNKKGQGQIIGIYVHSKRTNIPKRDIRKDIHKTIISQSCVVCGSNTEIICDHKNDLYNDIRVLQTSTQEINDFQPLCNHCNLQKRQVAKEEQTNFRIYSAKRILKYKIYTFEFPWEKRAFDKKCVDCKIDTFWYDPIEFERKIYCYISYIIPIIKEIKKLNKSIPFSHHPFLHHCQPQRQNKKQKEKID